MKTRMVWLYCLIALASLYVFYVVLVEEPMPDNPINLVHLLFRH